MKKIIYGLIVMSFIFCSTNLFSQDPPPPPGDAPSQGGGQFVGGGGAPIGEGIFIFSLLAAGYGGIKTWKNRKITPKGV